MNTGDCSYMVDTAAVFFDYVRIVGWFHSPTDELVAVHLAGKNVGGIYGTVQLPHSGVENSLGPNRGFIIQTMLEPALRTRDMQIVFQTKKGRTIRVRLLKLCDERKKAFKGRALLRKFMSMVNDTPRAKVLDIGGRARSGVVRNKMFKHAQYQVLDIMPGESVDVVGDAHTMSNLFPANSFDAVFSLSVFEHLLMPWIVVREMARVLRPGGVAYISTHQTIGVHDQPWDYWRFSDTAWDALFNRYTGFEIVDRSMCNPQYVTPHFWSPEQGDNLERAAGFLGSDVLARKVSEPVIDAAPVDVASLMTSGYPDTIEPVPVWYKKSRLFSWKS